MYYFSSEMPCDLVELRFFVFEDMRLDEEKVQYSQLSVLRPVFFSYEYAVRFMGAYCFLGHESRRLLIGQGYQ